MKRILLIIALALFVAAPGFTRDQPGFQNYEIKRGVGARDSDASREVKLVRHGNQAQDGASLVSGDLVVWSVNSDDGVTVTTTTTSGDGSIAGIIATTIQTADSVQNSAAEGLGRRNWGWMVVSGPMVVDVTAGGTSGHAAGDLLITSTDATTATTFSDPGVYGTNGTAIRGQQQAGGFFLDAAVAADTSAEVYLQLN